MKVSCKFILERLRNKINVEISDQQFGFRANSRTREVVLSIRMITENTYMEITEKKITHVCFIDYTKAFDRV